jgi:hypothetical protein
MNNKRCLYSTSLSSCCQSQSIIVRSRSGGFITQNCEKCEKLRAIQPSEFPPAKCAECQIQMAIVRLRKNYAYKCEQCSKAVIVHDIVPSWDERFDYHSFAIPGIDDILLAATKIRIYTESINSR